MWYRPAGDEYEDSVTGFSSVSLVLHDVLPEPPFLWKGVALKALEDSRLFAEKPRPCRGLM